jgi:ABC-2 type transport system ATP-binding protein
LASLALLGYIVTTSGFSASTIQRPAMTQPAISCRNLRKTYRAKPPVEALRGIDLEVREGECFGVLGPNGAGKTTAIELMEGLSSPTEGEVEVLGHRWSDRADDIRQQIGISLQETRFSEKLTVLETLTLFRSFYRRGHEPRHTMAQVSLTDKAHAWVKNLSGGQRQRLAVATALVGDPRLLFLDEPTTGLDPQSRRQLWKIVTDFAQQGGTVLLTTHYMEEAERLCDRVAIIDRGQIIALGTPRELIGSIGAEHVVEFAFDGDSSAGGDDEAWSSLPGVTGVTREDGHILLTVTEPHVVIPAVLQRIDGSTRSLSSLTTRNASLEDVFVKLTGRHLDREEPSDARRP